MNKNIYWISLDECHFPFRSQVQSYLNELWKGGLPWTANTIKV